MSAKIYKPAKTAMQSGEARTQNWILEYTPSSQREVDPIMGWTSSGDQKSQLRLRFSSKKEAIAYAKSEGISYSLIKPNKRARKPKAYADNFKTARLERWTH